MRHFLERFLTILAIADVFLLGSLARADDAVQARSRAPADYQIVSSDRAGAYFVARPLKERYDKLVGQLATLRLDIAEARLPPTRPAAGLMSSPRRLTGTQAANRIRPGSTSRAPPSTMPNPPSLSLLLQMPSC